nr:uncharacterized protein LOC109164445 [Ipomoea batatas]
MKLENSSGDHPEEDDGSNQVQQISPIKAPIGGDDDSEELIDLRAAPWERERLYVVNNCDKKPFVEDEDSNPAAACPWTLRTRPAGERNGRYDHNFTMPSCLKWGHQKRVRRMKLDNSSGDHTEEDDGSNQKLIDLRAAAVHPGEGERLYVVNNGDKKPFVEDEDSNPAAACPWTLRTRPTGERNGRYDHNFTLPSCLKLGHQKRVRRMKLDNSSGDHPEEDDGSNQVQQISPIKAPIGGDDDIEALR